MSTYRDALEQSLGMSLDEVRKTPLHKLRLLMEKKKGTKTSYFSIFPFIGRGNVMRDSISSHDEVEKDLVKALKGR